METKTSKRIVSKGEYAKIKGLGLSLRVSSRGFMALAFCCFGFAAWMFSYCACCILVLLWMLCYGKSDWTMLPKAIYFLLACGASGASGLGLKRICQVTRKRAEQIENVIVFTRSNTANLPAPDSLVRASSEPMQAREAVLLRAAAEGQETLPEHLVRAVNGQE